MKDFCKFRTEEGSVVKAAKDYYRKLFESGMNTEEAKKELVSYKMKDSYKKDS